MTEEKARAIMKAYGWFYTERRPRGTARYVYAKRRQGHRMVMRYIRPLSKLEDLTEQELVAKLVPQLTPEP
jgi:hypothetical protein